MRRFSYWGGHGRYQQEYEQMTEELVPAGGGLVANEPGRLLSMYMPAARRWENLPAARRNNRTSKSSDFFDDHISTLEPHERSGRYFYNTADVTSAGDIARLYDSEVLSMIGRGVMRLNPYQRAPWAQLHRAPDVAPSRLGISVLAGVSAAKPASKRRRRR